MRVAFVASEAIPYAKTGGLADVVGTLPRYLKELGIEVSIILPRYSKIEAEEILQFDVELNGSRLVKIYKKDNTYLIDYPEFFHREGLYGTPLGDYPDNCERFTLFCKAAYKLIEILGFDIVHCHDWQTGLISLYLKRSRSKLKTVFTIHNLGYQGHFAKEKFCLLGIEPEYFSIEGIEYYGGINFLKAGIVYSDIITTVSPTYAKEIQRPDSGFGLDGILRKRSDSVYGILNGIDYGIWNPQNDNLIYEKYRDFEGKQRNKLFLTNECLFDFNRPLLGMVSRVTEQKGFDILSLSLDDIVAMGYSFVLLGYGDEVYCKKLKKFEETYPHQVSINIKFDETLAHRIYAGCDFFLMPSRYEPCGLGQMISLKYGSVPIVHKTGGLADTITQFNSENLSGNGFVFIKYSPRALVDSLKEAYSVYLSKEVFKRLSENCMAYNFSWSRATIEYKRLYERLLS